MYIYVYVYVYIYHHHCSVPCVIALATMDFHLSQVQVLEIVFVGLSFRNHTDILSGIFSLCLPMPYPLNFPLVTKDSNAFLPITCAKNSACLFLASLTSDLVVPTLSSTSSFLILSTYGSLSICEETTSQSHLIDFLSPCG